MTQTSGPTSPALAPKTCQFITNTRRGPYQIQISWPLAWSEDRKPLTEVSEIPTIYIVDGNAYFFTLTEMARRIALIYGPLAILIGIGYPLADNIFHRQRRSEDLTPPTKHGYDNPPFNYGGASDFLCIIEDDIIPYVEDTLFPHLPLKKSPRALFGHSFGGLFTLNALFTNPILFDTFVACSPSIWWNDSSVVKEQEQDFHKNPLSSPSRPRLFVTYGSLEQYPEKRRGETDREYSKRRRDALSKGMKDNSDGLINRLKECPKLRSVWKWEFEGEDHGGAAPCGFQRALQRFLVDPES